jgi:TM2 domain-containing membrane protein YozV
LLEVEVSDSDFFSSIMSMLFCLIGLAILAGIIALAVYLIKKSAEEARHAEIAYNRMLQSLPQDKQMLFVMQYNSAQKNPTSALLLALFLGGLGIHKFYLGQTGLGIVYLLFCWTYIPSILAFFEIFVIAGQVGKYNQQKAVEIFAMLGGGTSMGLLPH